MSKLWKWFIIIIIGVLGAGVAILSAILIKITTNAHNNDRMRCYQCLHVSEGKLPGTSPEASDPACQGVPDLDGDYLLECPLSMGKDRFTCADVKFRGTNNDSSLVAVIRTCLPYYGTENSRSCISGSLGEVAQTEAMPELAQFLQYYLKVHGMNESLKVQNACTCTFDACNSSNGPVRLSYVSAAAAAMYFVYHFISRAL